MKAMFKSTLLAKPRLLATVALCLGMTGLLTGLSMATPHADNLPSSAWWRLKVQGQANAVHDRQFKGCLFGDSISSGLGNSLGQSTFNFAIGGQSSVSMLEQLKMLYASNVQCRKAIIAIGTNDAWYVIDNRAFTNNLRQSIAIVRAMGATEITVLPAFYSTIAASLDPSKAGPIERVDEISALIQQVADQENVQLDGSDLQPLFNDHSLKSALTSDGVHLNDSGKRIYRQVLVKLFNGRTIGSANF
ncbi:MAG: SGNH/GDSL hydrolase family protein [Myxacorys californica WJT36-NPBG1]|jgi:lysophospholipase L1-like esterase|nr:SGNH/GDSL hydrolase family protein [Myxacorys californica WJT36-NPBG1]